MLVHRALGQLGQPFTVVVVRLSLPGALPLPEADDFGQCVLQRGVLLHHPRLPIEVRQAIEDERHGGAGAVEAEAERAARVGDQAV